jgi:hypothetical protein
LLSPAVYQGLIIEHGLSRCMTTLNFRYPFLWFLCSFSASFSAFPQQSNYAPFGKVFTPKGDLRILIIYAGFADLDNNQAAGNWPSDKDLPPWDPTELFYSDFSEFEKYKGDTTVQNLSKFYYEFSHTAHKLRIVADILPRRINIDPSTAHSFSDCNRLVIEKMMAMFPDFDWRPYDQRKNFPNYKSDNSSSSPDMKPDYVVISYRYYSGWPTQPKKEMRAWAMNFSQLLGLDGIQYNGYSFDQSGFTMANFEGRFDCFKDYFIHELAHELYSCPHYSGANNTLGKYFNIPAMGWNMMNSTCGINANAFERWLLGWSEIKHDLRDFRDNGIYDIHDFITTGESIRIKIPHTENQYLWIENHCKLSVFDHKPWRGLLKEGTPDGKGIPDKEAGVYMFIEDVLPDRKSISSDLVYDMNKINGILPLHAEGNYDYLTPKVFTNSPQELWNNTLYWFERDVENPIAGTNPYLRYRNDMDSNGTISKVSGPFGEFNTLKNIEAFMIAKEILNSKPVLTYAFLGGRTDQALPYRRSDAFQVGDILCAGTNPMIINRPYYNINAHRQESFYLSGIYISILKKINNTVTIEVRFNEPQIIKNTRWCGNIVLKPLSHSSNSTDLTLKRGLILTLDKSGTCNSYKPPFITNTTFTIDSGAVFTMEAGSMVNVKEQTTFIIKKGGTLKMHKGSRLKFDSSAVLQAEAGSIIELHKAAFVQLVNKSHMLPGDSIRINRRQNIKQDIP